MEKSKSFINKEIDGYPKSSLAQSKELLNLVGAEKFEANGNWKNNLRGFELGEEKTRITKALSSKIKNGIINQEMDKLTECLVDTKTGEKVPTEFVELKINDIDNLSKNWLFDWRKPFKDRFSVFALKIVGNDDVQGLLSVKFNEKETTVEVGNIESAPWNSTYNKKVKDKKYEGVGAHLMAEAVKMCYNKYGRYSNGLGKGIVYFYAKTKLLEYYEKKIGATRYGEQLMALEGEGAKKLYEKYY